MTSDAADDFRRTAVPWPGETPEQTIAPWTAHPSFLLLLGSALGQQLLEAVGRRRTEASA